MRQRLSQKLKPHTNKVAVSGDPFGKLGNLPPGTRIKRGRSGAIKEDDPRWRPKRK